VTPVELRTDDDIYRARLVYIGPPGYNLPFHLPYAQWGLFAAIAGVLLVLGWLLVGLSWSFGLAVALAMVATSYIWSRVDADQPARKLLAVAATDWRHTRPDTEARLPALSARRIRIGDPP
jgi:hypothetical protein